MDPNDRRDPFSTVCRTTPTWCVKPRFDPPRSDRGAPEETPARTVARPAMRCSRRFRESQSWSVRALRSSAAPRERGLSQAFRQRERNALPTGNIELFRSEFTHRENTISTNPFSAETSGFAPLEKSDCSKCHQRSIAGDGCLICHKYHVTSPNSGAPSARLGSLAKPE